MAYCAYDNAHLSHGSVQRVIERNSGKIIKRLKEEGFELVSVRDSRQKFRKGKVTLVVTHPKKDLPTGTARQIAKQVGWI